MPISRIAGVVLLAAIAAACGPRRSSPAATDPRPAELPTAADTADPPPPAPNAGTDEAHPVSKPGDGVCPGAEIAELTPGSPPWLDAPVGPTVFFRIEEAAQAADAFSRLVVLVESMGDPCTQRLVVDFAVQKRRLIVTVKTKSTITAGQVIVKCADGMPSKLWAFARLPADLDGTYDLELRSGKKRDHYRLEVTRDRVEVGAEGATFSAFWSPSVLVRLAPGTMRVVCVEPAAWPACRTRPEGAPTCASFYGDAAFQELAPSSAPPGPYTNGRFNSPGGCLLAGTVEAADRATSLAATWRDPTGCLHAMVDSWRGTPAFW